MPRRKPHLNDPDDPDEVKKFVKDLANCSNYKALQKLANNDPEPSRFATLERRNLNQALEINCQSRKAAVAIHVYGRIAEKACQKCRDKHGPFVHCVVLEDFDDLSLRCCSNCRWKGFTRITGTTHSCDAVKGNNERDLL